ncbi:arginase family protein [Herbiconiux sp. CPCC 203407]|uniref:Arginase family protein n=1 Tax=Herbiconiux oxytropis TaxID=2970915 RepID=A0AA41XGW7_9MICO|nr:arginase family protein [Herbiconiux oxytropis]MCS5724170.1 arginase family protein [Herbiconiux oxytropis]MCS5725463.1 arginase family protein [Herbiconiux oxytropis]
MTVTVLGVPSSTGAYCVGVERAPAALREAGLIDELERAGGEVVDAGDLPLRRWTPDHQNPFAQNVTEEARSLEELADAAARLLGRGAASRLLVLGGACTIAVGLGSALRLAGLTPRIVYIDRHLDLNTPESTREGSLSWMGMGHALGLDGAAAGLVPGGGPLLRPADLVYLGVDTDAVTSWERAEAERLGVVIVPQGDLVADARGAARSARGALDEGPFVVHLDVDVLDFLDAPIAENVNGRNSGPTLEQLEPALAELCRHPSCLGLTIGQLDPNHAAADPTALPRLVGVLGRVLGGL